VWHRLLIVAGPDLEEEEQIENRTTWTSTSWSASPAWRRPPAGGDLPGDVSDQLGRLERSR